MIELRDVSFAYQNGTKRNGIYHINLEIEQGEVILLCGGSGCGKTTVTRLINGLIPNYYEGELRGEILIDGNSVLRKPLYAMAEVVGSVFQNPRSQFFNVDTTSELAFGCENLGFPQEEIKERMRETVSEFQLEYLMGRNIFKLSGGEKQKLACASVHMAHPDIYVLDEPSSNLDFVAIEELRKNIDKWKKQKKTVVIAEHRLYFLRDLVDKVVYMEDGRIDRIMTGKECRERGDGFLCDLGLRPFSLEYLKRQNKGEEENREIFSYENILFSYKKGIPILDIPKLDITKYQVTAIIGANGAGKSTLARILCGLEKKGKGVFLEKNKKLSQKERLKRSYMVMQDVNHQLFTESVKEEVLLSMEKREEPRAKEILEKMDLSLWSEEHPMSLSGGQKQRVAIASSLASQKDILLFDEPTSGLDLKHMKEVSQNILKVKDLKKTVLLISHDLEFIMSCADSIVCLEKGKVKETYFLDEQGERKLKNWFLKESIAKEAVS